jgi:hypothetical protein
MFSFDDELSWGEASLMQSSRSEEIIDPLHD